MTAGVQCGQETHSLQVTKRWQPLYCLSCITSLSALAAIATSAHLHRWPDQQGNGLPVLANTMRSCETQPTCADAQSQHGDRCQLRHRCLHR